MGNEIITRSTPWRLKKLVIKNEFVFIIFIGMMMLDNKSDVKKDKKNTKNISF